MRPQTEVGVFPVEQFVPGRLDLSLITPSWRRQQHLPEPEAVQAAVPRLHDVVPARLAGSHDFKFGFEARRDRRNLGNDQPFNIYYRETTATSEVDLFNGPVAPTNDVNVRSAYVQDNWKFNNRLTLNLGLRMDHYTDGWPEQEFAPTACRLAGTAEQRIIDSSAKNDRGRAVSKSTTVGPRAGFTYDLHGNGKSVIKGYYGRFYFNSADIIADNQNPVGFAQLRYQFVPRPR